MTGQLAFPYHPPPGSPGAGGVVGHPAGHAQPGAEDGRNLQRQPQHQRGAHRRNLPPGSGLGFD